MIIDEAAELVPSKIDKDREEDLKACQKALSFIWRIGGAFGVNGIIGTQYPTADVLDRQLKQTSDTRICFRLPEEYASEVVLGEGNGQAAHLPDDVRGRAIYKTHDFKVAQVPYLDDETMWELLGGHTRYEAPIEIRIAHDTSGEDTVEFGKS